ncbi:hypothetical protein C0Z19_24070 [Trinickia soli]|uniref:Uncharacterized protein n=1 Tax=Trinickia soli TaxID=380675 RepID=A0A2N7VKW2_9BURK|nr:hypothetical protein C0Z19_24070 [Trinickia soli]
MANLGEKGDSAGLAQTEPNAVARKMNRWKTCDLVASIPTTLDAHLYISTTYVVNANANAPKGIVKRGDAWIGDGMRGQTAVG